MLLPNIACSDTIDAAQTHKCGQLKFTFICIALCAKLQASFSARSCISSRRVSRTPNPRTRLNLGRTIQCRTHSKHLLHLALSHCLQPAGALRALAFKKILSSLIQHRSHRSLHSTANIADFFGARFTKIRRALIFKTLGHKVSSC